MNQLQNAEKVCNSSRNSIIVDHNQRKTRKIRFQIAIDQTEYNRWKVKGGGG